MTISSPGIGSSLDVNSIITQLMALEGRSVTALDTKEASYQAKLTAYGSLKGALSSFQLAVQALATPAKFTANKASIADATVVSASAGSSAAAGSYGIEVTALAQAQKLKTSSTFTAGSSTLGSGTLTIRFGTYSAGTFTPNADKDTKTIAVAAGQNSLSGVRDAINAANVGVSASIVNDGSGNRLVISSKDTGTANALKITVADDDSNNTDNAGLSQLAYDASTGGTANLSQTQAAQNAAAIVDGITVSKASNSFSDVIEGVTLTLLKTNAGAPTTLTVARDTGSIKSAVESFVKAYNDASKVLKDLSAYDAATKKGAILQGDSTVRSIQSQLRAVLNGALTTAGGGLTALSDIGVTFQKDGTLALNSTRLQQAMDDPAKDIATLFAAVGKPTDSLVAFAGSSAATKGGNFAVNVTQLATQGKAVGAVTLGGSTTITAGLDDTLSVSIDGTSATVTLAAGSYTAAQMAAEVQSKINGASALSTAGIAVAVTESAGVLTLTSNRYGSTSTATASGGSAQAALFGTTTDTAGLNVAGTIGGFGATGTGQTLTGSGDSAGLQLTINGGTTGNRGTVKFAQGYAYQLNTLVGDMLDSDGILAGRTDGIGRSIKDIGNQRSVLQLRLLNIEQRYRAQFTALDTLISSMNKTSSFLTQQLDNLPKAGGNN